MTLDDKVKVFKALGDATRFRIVLILSDHPELCACHLLSRFQISQPTLSHHMKILRDAGLVRARRVENWTYYRLSSLGKRLIQMNQGTISPKP